jgi:hypothetical protein
MIEALNQLALFNRRRFLSANMTLRQRTTEAVMNLLSGQKEKLNWMRYGVAGGRSGSTSTV